MTSFLVNSVNLLLFLLLCLFSSNHPLSSTAFDFDVGDETGWAVPPAKDTQFYNQWASRNRFKIGDTVHFKYAKDSVMLVSEEEYEKCRSMHPIFFSNNGKTEFTLDRSGLFYFISGVAGHCERGEKMIIKVMSQDDEPSGSPPAGGNQTGNSTTPGSPDHKNGAAVPATAWALGVATVQVIAMLFGSVF